MRKRKKPILLITILVLLVGSGVAMNVINDPNRAHDHSVAEQPEDLGESRSTDRGDIGASVASSLGGTDTEPSTPVAEGSSAEPKKAKMKLGGSGLVRPRASSVKPKPNDTITGAQWYRDGAGGYDPDDQK